jgi:hypothetical protein
MIRRDEIIFVSPNFLIGNLTFYKLSKWFQADVSRH